MKYTISKYGLKAYYSYVKKFQEIPHSDIPNNKRLVHDLFYIVSLLCKIVLDDTVRAYANENLTSRIIAIIHHLCEIHEALGYYNNTIEIYSDKNANIFNIKKYRKKRYLAGIKARSFCWMKINELENLFDIKKLEHG